MTDCWPPQDIKHLEEWLKLVRHLQSKSRSQQGLAGLTTTIFVNQDGRPLSWLAAVKTEIQPKGNSDEFLTLLENMNIVKRSSYPPSK